MMNPEEAFELNARLADPGASRKKSLVHARAVCNYWNEHFPVGTKVTYHPRGVGAGERVTVTTGPAMVIHGKPVIAIGLRQGRVALDKVVGPSR